MAETTEQHCKSDAEILDAMGNLIAHNADLYVVRTPSTKQELFDRRDLRRMRVCGGATGLKVLGAKKITFCQPKIVRSDLRQVIKKIKPIANNRQ